MATTATAVHWDAAISFLDQDRQHALEIVELLRDRAKVFVYSNHQELLVGRNGVRRFAEVFGKEARLVVVLYRQGWGDTDWTNIESEAINTRQLNSRTNDVLTVVKLDDSDAPTWLPASRIWGKWEPFGAAGVAAVIVSRVQELGNQVRPETPADVARRIAAKQEWASRREKFLAERGWDAAKAAAGQVFATLNRVALSCGCKLAHAPDGESVALSCDYLSVTVALSRSLNRPSDFVIKHWDGLPFPGFAHIDGEEISVARFRFDLEPPDIQGWREVEAERPSDSDAVVFLTVPTTDGRFQTSEQLAESITMTLLRRIEQRSFRP